MASKWRSVGAMTLAFLPLILGIAASGFTLLGGMLALRLGSRIHLVLGLTAGIVLGVAFFDLVPEAVAMGSASYGPRALLAALAVGFTVYLIVDRALAGSASGGRLRPHLGPAALSLHSLLDGIGIGLAFQISTAIGGTIALAVLAHDFADGVNTVGLSLSGGWRGHARRWLIVNAAAPLIGVVLGSVIALPAPVLALLLAGFAGIFLYIGACELIPRSYATSSRLATTITTLAGMTLMYVVTELASI